MHKNIQPVIIIGMHRSGTTMVTEILGRLGLFMGADLEKNNESRFFIKLNAWLLRECGAKWDRPISASMLLQNTKLAELTLDYLNYQLSNWPVHKYAGLSRYIASDLPCTPRTSWGWKDPRNTFTLPLWLQLYPEAKIIHVYRNGVDIASSLKVRAENDLIAFGKRHEILKKSSFYRMSKKHRGFTGSATALDIHKGFSLWEQYVETAFSYEEVLGNRLRHVCYEEFLASPLEQLRGLVSFCNLEPTELELKESISDVKPSRGFAFHSDPMLETFYNEVRNSRWMSKLGYNKL